MYVLGLFMSFNVFKLTFKINIIIILSSKPQIQQNKPKHELCITNLDDRDIEANKILSFPSWNLQDSRKKTEIE